jgi:hypothetical protein
MSVSVSVSVCWSARSAMNEFVDVYVINVYYVRDSIYVCVCVFCTSVSANPFARHCKASFVLCSNTHDAKQNETISRHAQITTDVSTDARTSAQSIRAIAIMVLSTSII